MIFARRCLVLWCTVFSLSVDARNLLQNPTFDSDIDGWETTTDTAWSWFDHGDSVPGGSLQIASHGEDFARQCVAARQDTDYLFSIWAMANPIEQADPCTNPEWQLTVEWWDGPDCNPGDALYLGGSTFRHVPASDVQWNNETHLVQSPSGTRQAQVTISATCGEHRGDTIVFFDDVSLSTERIFADSFETPAPHIDPAQPRGG